MNNIRFFIIVIFFCGFVPFFFFCSMQSIQNLGLAVFALVTGSIVDNNGYLILEVFFLACLCSEFSSYLLGSFNFVSPN